MAVRSSVIFALAFIALVPILPIHAEQSAFDEGLEQVKYKRYFAAADCFTRAVNKDPGSQKAHFDLARCLEMTKQYESARDEYEVTYRLNPFTPEGRTSREAVLDMGTKIGSQKHPADDPKLYLQAIREIDRQTADNKTRWINWGDRQANYRINLGQIEAAKLNADARLTRWSMHRGLVGGTYEMSSAAQINAHYQVTDSNVQASKYRTEGYHAATETQNSANLLKQLLSEAPKPGQPRLRALGTCLYVRNYGDFDDLPTPDPPLELRADAERLDQLPKELHAAAIHLESTAGGK